MVLIRDKTQADDATCLSLLLDVHRDDGYPLHLPPEEVQGFFSSDHETAAWVAESGGRVVGHVALHGPPEDPTVSAASRATGIAPDGLALVCRLFTARDERRTGLGRQLLRHAAAQAHAQGRRAVLDVGQSLHPAVALYEAEGWSRVDELHLPLDGSTVLDLWVYVSPAAEQR